MSISLAHQQSRIDRAYAKAMEQARVGNLPTAITARAWSSQLLTPEGISLQAGASIHATPLPLR